MEAFREKHKHREAHTLHQKQIRKVIGDWIEEGQEKGTKEHAPQAGVLIKLIIVKKREQGEKEDEVELVNFFVIMATI